MALNMALKRAAKANRRKIVLAEKRKLELRNDTLAERVIRASRAPIQHCLVPETLFDQGLGSVVLARGFTSSYLTLGLFLVDAWCLGIKDVCFRSADAETFESMIEAVNETMPMASVDPSYARKLLRDVAAWAAPIGFAPHRDFAAVEQLFGDVSADASHATFQFGREGKPLYMSGPNESPAQIGHRLAQLRNGRGIERLFVDLDDV